MQVAKKVLVGAALAFVGFTTVTATSTASATQATNSNSWPVTAAVAASAQSATGLDEVAPMDGLCRIHYVPGGGSARACRSWYPQPGRPGYYYGSYSWSGTRGVRVQGSFDGRVADLAPSGPYNNVKVFLTRACRAGQCSGWS